MLKLEKRRGFHIKKRHVAVKKKKKQTYYFVDDVNVFYLAIKRYRFKYLNIL